MNTHINPYKIRIETGYIKEWMSQDTFDEVLEEGEMILYKNSMSDSYGTQYPVLKVQTCAVDKSTLSKIPGIPLSFQQITSMSNNDIGTTYNRKTNISGEYIYPIANNISLGQYGSYFRIGENDDNGVTTYAVNQDYTYTFRCGILIQPHGYTMQTGIGDISQMCGSNRITSKKCNIKFYPITNANATAETETIEIIFSPIRASMQDTDYVYVGINDTSIATYNIYPSVNFTNLTKLKDLGFVDYDGSTAATVSQYTITKPMPIQFYMG